jgi:hypothetical protein
MDTAVITESFCTSVTDTPGMSNATARVGAWLIGAALKTGGFPVELTMKQFREGFERNGVVVEGTGCRHETVKAAIKWLEKEGLLKVEPNGNTNKYTMVSK